MYDKKVFRYYQEINPQDNMGKNSYPQNNPHYPQSTY